MPRLTAETGTTTASAFAFSAIDFNQLGATEYTLVGISLDRSGSVYAFQADMEKALQEIVAACRRSPRADNLLLRVTTFDSALTEVNGFKLLQDVKGDDYKGCLPAGGMTALYDASVDAVDAVARYGKTLQEQDMSVNGIVFVVTDGCNNAGRMTVGEVKKSLERAVRGEMLESMVSILIGVNVQDAGVKATLEDYARDAGFSQYVNLADASEKTLAKLASFVSRSISSQSQALGTGGASKTLSF